MMRVMTERSPFRCGMPMRPAMTPAVVGENLVDGEVGLAAVFDENGQAGNDIGHGVPSFLKLILILLPGDTACQAVWPASPRHVPLSFRQTYACPRLPFGFSEHEYDQ